MTICSRSQIDYTYGTVVATLAMIESPSTQAYILDQDKSDVKSPLLEENAAAKDADVLLVRSQPITAKLRTAVRHLRSIAGPLARFRGLHIALIYNFLYSLILAIFKPAVPSIFQPVIAVLASIALCRIHMTWTHALIAMPTSKSWVQRIPSMKMSRRLIVPTAIWAIAVQACFYIPESLFLSAHDAFRHPEVYGGNPEHSQKIALIQVFGAMLAFFVTLVLIVVPAEVCYE